MYTYMRCLTFLHTDPKFFGKGTSSVRGKMAVSLTCPSIQSMRREMYWLAGSLVGFLNLDPSCQRYSYFGPPDMVGHVESERAMKCLVNK